MAGDAARRWRLASPAAAQPTTGIPTTRQRSTPPFAADGKPSDVELHAAREGREALEHLRLLPAHEGCLLAGRRLRRGRGGQATWASRCNWSRPAATPSSTSRSRQIEDCVAGGAKAVVIGAISFDGLNNLVTEIRKKNIPVIDVINGISSPDLTAKSLVSFDTMGYEAGEYLAKMHPAGSDPVKVGWFPGPAGAGWVEAANKGFLEAVKGSGRRGARAQVRRHRQGSAAQAGRGRAAGQSGHPLHRRHRRDRRSGAGPDPRARPARARSRSSPST